MKIFIIICLSVFVCNSQYVDYKNLQLHKTFLIIEEVIKKGDDLDDLVKFLSDTAITSTDRTIRFHNDIKGHVLPISKKLVNHITKNKFQNGYVIEKEKLFVTSFSIEDNVMNCLSFHVKVRSNETKDIIWFFFDNHDGGIWKLQDYDFCNNPPSPEGVDPCDKK